MPIGRNIFIKGFKYIYLLKSIIDMIIASNDMGYFRVQIINYYAEIISGRSIASLNNKIFKLII